MDSRVCHIEMASMPPTAAVAPQCHDMPMASIPSNGGSMAHMAPMASMPHLDARAVHGNKSQEAAMRHQAAMLNQADMQQVI